MEVVKMEQKVELEDQKNVKVELEDQKNVKVELEDQKNVKVELEDQKNVKVELEDQKNVKVEMEDQSMEESVVEKLEVKMLIHDSVVSAVESGPILLALVDPSTGFCHGLADIWKVQERVSRSTIAGGKRIYHCNKCNYCSKDRYLITRHVARIHSKSVDSKRCWFCDFSTIYPSNLTRHIQRAHSNQD